MRLNQIEKFGVSEADNDDLLLDCFEDHEAYLAARQHKKFLIIGRKGAGKTAIFRKLVSESSAGRFCNGHSFSDYPWFHHDKQRSTGVPDAECYRYSWEYVILISIAKMILTNDVEPWSDESLSALARLESFVVDSYGTKSPQLRSFFSPNTVLRVRPQLSSDLEPSDEQSITIDRLPSIVYEVNQSLFSAILACVKPYHSYQICFDELDRGFTINDENYKHRLSGLLIAARDFNRRARSEDASISAIVFLRDDIMRHLRFEDKNKIVEDFSSTIEWDMPSSSNSLRHLMSKRFSNILGIPEMSAWDSVFDEQSQMTGRQSKYQYILDRTLNRPRDIIKYCNEVLRQYKITDANREKFDNVDVTRARDEYSRYLKKELTDEMHQHFPEEQDAFDVLRVVGSISFTIGAFKHAHSTVEARKQLPSSTYLLKQLYDFSAIAFLKVGGTGGGSEWVWKYKDTEVEYDDRATIFRAHSGLKEILELKQGRVFSEEERLAGNSHFMQGEE